MKTFREFVTEGAYDKKLIINALKDLGKVTVPAIGNSGYDVYIMVNNKNELKGLKEKVQKILKKEFGSKMIKTSMFPNGYDIQAPWPENKDESDDKEWELMMSFK
jgi:hypothetical protein